METLIGLPCLLLSSLISIACTAFWIWMLVDCLINESSNGNEKLVWTLLIVLLPFVGSAIYFLVRRPRRKSDLGR